MPLLSEGGLEMKLIHGDATDDQLFQPLRVHSVICDPPFFAEKATWKQLRKKNKNQLKPICVPPPEEYGKFWDRVCRNCEWIIDEKGWFMYKADFRTMMVTHPITLQWFDFIGDIVWNKKRIGTGYYIRKQHEYILIYRPKKACNSFTAQRPMRKGLKSSSHGSSKGLAFRSVIELLNSNGGEFGHKKRNHINHTESALWERFIRYFVPHGATVGDPFMGGGSVGVACKKLERDYIGVELDEEFFEEAKATLAKITHSHLISSYFKN